MNATPTSKSAPSVKKILVVMSDETPDKQEQYQFVGRTLQECGFSVFLTSSPFTAMQEMRAAYPLVIVEMNLPGFGGLELLQTAKSFDPDTQVLIVGDESCLKDLMETLRLGAFDYMLKPISDAAEILNKVNNALSTRNLVRMNKRLMRDLKLKNEQLLKVNQDLAKANSEIELWNMELEARVQERTQDIEQLLTSTVKSIMRAVEAKDPYTHGHSTRVTAYSAAIGRELGLDDDSLAALMLSAELHDIGKIGITDKILTFPGKLTDEELAIMRTHTLRGVEILEPLRMLNYIIPGVRWHHEWWDGSGYPDRLKGEQIPQQARIIGIADTFDAMTSTRTYQKQMDPDWVVGKIQGWANTRYDPVIVDAFVRGYQTGRICVIASDESLVKAYGDGEIPVLGPPPKG